jgi:hypothetical protein
MTYGEKIDEIIDKIEFLFDEMEELKTRDFVGPAEKRMWNYTQGDLHLAANNVRKLKKYPNVKFEQEI